MVKNHLSELSFQISIENSFSTKPLNDRILIISFIIYEHYNNL